MFYLPQEIPAIRHAAEDALRPAFDHSDVAHVSEWVQRCIDDLAHNAALGAGAQIQNAPYNYWNQFSQGANSIGQGYGTTTGTQQMPGNPLMGAMGGAKLGNQLYNSFGSSWGSGMGSAADTAAGANFWAPNFAGGMGD